VNIKKILLIALLFLFTLVTVGLISKKSSSQFSPKTFFSSVSNIIKKKPKNVCYTNEKYEEIVDPNAPILSIPFDLKNYSTKHWGIVPFCALIGTGKIHGALDFELKPDAMVYASADGVVEHTQVGKEEGSGEIISINGNGFNLSYSGLTNLQVKAGDTVKRGDYIANAVRIPHGEHHVHLGININGKDECPLKYMDEEFLAAFKEMFPQADYRSQTDARCACDCETVTPDWR